MRSDRYSSEPDKVIGANFAAQQSGKHAAQDTTAYEEPKDAAAQRAKHSAESAKAVKSARPESPEAGEAPADQEAAAAAAPEEAPAEKKSRFGGKKSRKSGKGVKLTKDSEPIDLTKLKKKELLEIMLRQGEEIDKLRDQVKTLQAELDDKYVKINKLGSIGEASLALTKIFDEADKAVKIYLENVRRRVNG